MSYWMGERKFEQPMPSLAGKYVVYDPPAKGLPYVGVLFMPGSRPKALIFETEEQAISFLTSDALGEL
ncbi:MAG: hypothetical protein KF810_23720 [Rhizobiaceae bacterium]|nr:hypothetical protein [Rhizobiaceae bacterium]